MTDLEFKEIKALIQEPHQVVILSHRNPDGDAVGSSLALSLFLKKFFHKVRIILPSEYPAMLSYLPELDDILIYDIHPDESIAAIEEANLIFLLDFNALDRIDKMGETVLFSKAVKIMIDHHLDPEPVSDYLLSDTEASSTCELVYYLISRLGEQGRIDPMMGSCLFTGLITDTGSFKYGTRPYTYEVAAQLKKLGVDDYDIQNQIFNSLNKKHLLLLGHCLANRMKILEDTGAAYIYLNKQDYLDFNIQRGDTEGIVNYLLMMKDIVLAGFITEQPTMIKISLRSKGEVNVQEMAVNHFKGGGHKNASGGAAYAKLEDIINRFEKTAPKYTNKN